MMLDVDSPGTTAEQLLGPIADGLDLATEDGRIAFRYAVDRAFRNCTLRGLRGYIAQLDGPRITSSGLGRIQLANAYIERFTYPATDLSDAVKGTTWPT